MPTLRKLLLYPGILGQVYLALTGYSVYLAVSGYRPENWILFLLLMAPGALLCMTIIVRVLRASSEGPGSGTDSQVPSNKPMEAP